MSIVYLDRENADIDLTGSITVLTHTPDLTANMLCQGYIQLGDGVKDLDGSGGNFEFVITVGGQTIQPSPQIVNLGTEVKASLWTVRFPVPVNQEVIFKVKSPNAADSDVDVIAYLFDVGIPVSAIAEFIAEHIEYRFTADIISDYFVAEYLRNYFIAESVDNYFIAEIIENYFIADPTY